MREKKHSKHIRAGNLVCVIRDGCRTFDASVTWIDSCGVRHKGQNAYIARGTIGLVLATGKKTDSITGGTCTILTEERKLEIVGNYWIYFEVIKREKE